MEEDALVMVRDRHLNREEGSESLDRFSLIDRVKVSLFFGNTGTLEAAQTKISRLLARYPELHHIALEAKQANSGEYAVVSAREVDLDAAGGLCAKMKKVHETCKTDHTEN